MTPRVREILSWYGADNVGVLTNFARLLNHGRLQGTGKLVILPVDQGFEHGPARSFAKNPDGYDLLTISSSPLNPVATPMRPPWEPSKPAPGTLRERFP